MRSILFLLLATELASAFDYHKSSIYLRSLERQIDAIEATWLLVDRDVDYSRKYRRANPKPKAQGIELQPMGASKPGPGAPATPPVTQNKDAPQHPNSDSAWNGDLESGGGPKQKPPLSQRLGTAASGFAAACSGAACAAGSAVAGQAKKAGSAVAGQAQKVGSAAVGAGSAAAGKGKAAACAAGKKGVALAKWAKDNPWDVAAQACTSAAVAVVHSSTPAALITANIGVGIARAVGAKHRVTDDKAAENLAKDIKKIKKTVHKLATPRIQAAKSAQRSKKAKDEMKAAKAGSATGAPKRRSIAGFRRRSPMAQALYERRLTT